MNDSPVDCQNRRNALSADKANPVIPTKIADLTAFSGQIGANLIRHRRQNTVVFNCRIRCPSELGLLYINSRSSIFYFGGVYEKHKGYSYSTYGR